MTSHSRLEVLTHIIKERRSIFPPVFSDMPIADDLILLILENANWAPTHKKTEPWRFHVITGQSSQRLSQVAGQWYEDNMTDNYSSKKHEKIMYNPIKSSHVIAISMQRDPQERIPQWEEVAAVSCAVQNLWLSATAAGIGGYWSTPQYLSIMHKVIEMKEGEHCMGLFFLGIPIAGYEGKSTRTPIQEKVKWYL